MRLIRRSNILAALAVCSLLYALHFLFSERYFNQTMKIQIPDVQDSNVMMGPSSGNRLVVFGDSWSDRHSRHEEQGPLWTEWLCSMFSCEMDSIAKSAPLSSKAPKGAVVDNGQLSEFQLGLSSWLQEPLPDLGVQIAEWLVEEKAIQESLAPEEIKVRQNNTIFVVSFCVWDLWKFKGQDKAKAESSIQPSITSAFEKLSGLAKQWGPYGIKVILTSAVDVTFLPAFNAPLDVQKDMVALIAAWNQELRYQAEKFSNGTVYYFDTNRFMLDQIREWQFFAAGMINELGKNIDPGWENVKEPCALALTNWGLWHEITSCEKPEKYLFWDDMHMGPSAHRIMATEIFNGIESLWILTPNGSQNPFSIRALLNSLWSQG